jgi:heptosyltransferase-2
LTSSDVFNEIVWKTIWLTYIGLFLFFSIICFPLFIWKKFNRNPIKNKKPKTILLLKFGHIGDTILTLPVLKALKENFSSSTIVFIVASWAEEIMVNSPFVDKFIIFDDPFYNRRVLTELNIPKKLQMIRLQKILKFLITIRNLHCDVVFDLNGTFNSLIYTYLSGAKHLIGYDPQGIGYLLDDKVQPTEDKQIVDQCLDVIRILGVKTDVQGPFIFSSNKDKLYAQTYFQQNNIHEDDLIVGIHPGAPFIPRRWPKERFAKIADILVKKYNAKIIYFGGKDEVDLVTSILSLMEKPAFSLVGKTTIRESIALIERCNFFICNDSSLMHIAALLNIPVIALFGPGQYPLFAPYNEFSVVVREDVGCNPCNESAAVWRKMCKRGRVYCMEAITIQKVLQIISQKISKINKNSFNENK